MNTLTLIGGVGFGFTVSSCLFFFVIGMVAKPNKQIQAETRAVNERTLHLLAERNEIDRKIAGHLHTLALCASQAAAQLPSEDNARG